jgi:hypothetical protein
MARAQTSFGSQSYPLVLQELRDMSVRKREEYVNWCKKIERSLELHQRRMDGSRKRSNGSDGTALLHGEAVYLQSQAKLMKQKMDGIRRRQTEMEASGLQNCLAPKIAELDQFGKDFARAMPNIQKLLRAWDSRVKVVRKEFDSITELKSVISQIGAHLELLNAKRQRIKLDFFSAQEELCSLVAKRRKSLYENMENRTKALGSELASFERQSQEVFMQTQDLISDAQICQYDLRKSFDKAMEKIHSQFQGQLGDVRKNIFALSEHRNREINGMRDRLYANGEEVLKKRMELLKETISDGESKKTEAVRSELENLRQQVGRLEDLLRIKLEGNGDSVVKKKRRRKNVKKKSGIFRVFYSVEDGGKVKLIFVDPSGAVSFRG